MYGYARLSDPGTQHIPPTHRARKRKSDKEEREAKRNREMEQIRQFVSDRGVTRVLVVGGGLGVVWWWWGCGMAKPSEAN